MMHAAAIPWSLWTSCLVGALIFLPTARAAEAPPMPTKVVTIEGITEYRLPNGCRILLFPDKSTSKVTVNMTVLVGSRHEGYGETGMAHLLEHMVFKGTPTFPNVPKALRDHGATFNGTTWLDRTNYFEILPANDENLEFGLRLEADRLVNSFIKREDLASEMSVVRNEFEAGENSPENILSQRIIAAAYEWHNYGKSTIGNRSDIERVPIERLQEFYRRYYQPDNIVVIVAGNFDEAKALELIGKTFGVLPRPQRKLDATYTEEPPQDGERSVTLRRVGKVGMVGAVYHIPAAAHADYPPLEVLAAMLDSEPTGRLYTGLVKTRLATRVSTEAMGGHDPGVFEITAQAGEEKPLLELRDRLLELMEKPIDAKAEAAEVERAKLKLAKNRDLLMNDSNRIGIALSDWAARGDWRLFFLHRDRIAAVKPEDVARVAARYFTPTNRTVGLYIPSDKVERTSVPATPDVVALVKDYQSKDTVAAGESFDPTLANIEKNVQESKLASGVKVALFPKKTRGEAVFVQLSLHYGNADSLRKQATAANFLATLMQRGTKTHTRQQLDDEFDRLKARVRFGGSLSQLNVSIECQRDKLPAVIALVGEILREPTFPAEEFDVLKRDARAAATKEQTEPIQLAVRALIRKIAPYPRDDVRYTPTIEETLAMLDATTVEDVKKLYAQLGGQNGELVAIGDFDPQATLRGFEKALEGWKGSTAYARIERPAPTDVAGSREVIVTPDKANACYFAGMLLPVKDTDPDHAALLIGNYLFGGGPLSSRLANRVRQKEGLSYSVGSAYSADAFDRSARFVMVAIYNPQNKDKVDSAILDELDQVLRSPLPLKEVQEAKEAYLKDQQRGRGDNFQLAALLKESLETGRGVRAQADLEKRIDALTAEQVSEALRKYADPKKLVILQAGDFNKKEEPPK
jgi:zinc protease